MKKIRMMILIVLTVIFCYPIMAEADDISSTYEIYKETCAKFRKNNGRLRADVEVVIALVEEKVSNDVAVKFRNSAHAFLDEALKMINKSDDLLKSLPNNQEEKIKALIVIGKKLEIAKFAHKTIDVMSIAIVGVVINDTEELHQFLNKNFGI